MNVHDREITLGGKKKRLCSQETSVEECTLSSKQKSLRSTQKGEQAYLKFTLVQGVIEIHLIMRKIFINYLPLWALC